MLNEFLDINHQNNDYKTSDFFQLNSNKKRITSKNYRHKSEDRKIDRYDLGKSQISNSNDEKFGHNIAKCDSMVFYRDKIQKFQKRKQFSTSDMITTSIDFNDKTTERFPFFTNLKIKTKNNYSKGNSSMLNKIIGLNKIKYKKKKAKKVTYKKKFVTYIDVESYKKYNMENCCFNGNDKTETKCTCLII